MKKYIDAEAFADWYDSYSITDSQREEAEHVAYAVDKFEPADVIPITELKAHIYKMNHRHICNSLALGGYKQALEEMLGWIVGYGEDESGK